MRALGITVVVALLGLTWGKQQWWEHASIYQIYPRSFYDSDGDGIGDLQGMIDKLNYIKDLDVDAVWLAPMFKSPQKDFGYDVSDFKDIDPIFGNLTLFANLTKSLHDMGIYVVMEFVPNHSSDEHEWFRKALKGDPKYCNYYIWKDHEDIKNNNWISIYGNKSWECLTNNKHINGNCGKCYYHLFSKSQPDLNYKNPDVTKEMEDILNFWMFMGSDGFTMSSAFGLVEDDDPKSETFNKNCTDTNDYFCYDHTYTADQERTREILAQLKKSIDKIPLGINSLNGTRFMAVETLSEDCGMVEKYYENFTNVEGDMIGPVSNFPINYSLMKFTQYRLDKASRAMNWTNAVKNWIKNCSTDKNGIKHSLNWMLDGNQNYSRLATRFGTESVDAMNIMNLLLKGTVFTYYGQEIGMTDSFVRPDQVKDINQMAKNYPERLRDPKRAPFQWNATVSGFTNNSKPWLPMSPDLWQINVDVQNTTDNNTHLNIFKQMVKLRKTLVVKEGDMDLASPATDSNDSDILVLFRSLSDNPTVIGVFNLGPKEEKVNLYDLRNSLPPKLYLYTTSINVVDKSVKDAKFFNTTEITIPPKAAMVFLTTDPKDPIIVDGSESITLL